MSSSSLVDLMEKCKEEYYQKENKNIFFKKGQKLDCAKKISETFSLEDMLNATVYILPNTNKIVFNYPIFKLYANNDVYNIVIQKVITLYDILLTTYTTFEVHISLDTFTITAAERYKSIIQLFCEKCMNSQTSYIQHLQGMYVYYTPSMIESISTLLKPFIDASILHRITYYSKGDSKSLLEKLHV
jgi:hypothetical protein